MKGKKKTKSFLAGAAILGIAGLICKVIGAVYRIPLSNYILHKEGIAYYQIAYPVYTALLVVSSAGLPTAISRMVAQRVQQGRERDALSVFHWSLMLLLAIGIVTSAAMALFCRPIARMLGNEGASFALLAIAPALMLVAVMSAYRGYFQGMQNMTPTAVSQLIEQIGKLAAGFPLAAYMMRYGPEYGAAGALLGVSISEGLALLYVAYRKLRYSGELKKRLRWADGRAHITHDGRERGAQIIKGVVSIAVPITIGASIMPLVGMTDTMIVINRLQDIGFAKDVATNLYGLFTGNVNTVVNMPQVLTVALSMALVPAITAHMTARNYRAMKFTVRQGMKLAWMIGMPCFIGLLMLAKPVMRLLYSSYSAEDLNTMAGLLRIMSLAIMFLSVVQTTTGILQGLGRIIVPVISLAIGAVFKVVINYVLVGVPSINIYGAPIGTIVCYAVAAGLNSFMICFITRTRFSFGETIGKPAIAALTMAFVLAIMMVALPQYADSRVFALVGVCVGAAVYALMLVLTGAITPEDMAIVPGGARITALMRRMGIWR
ncbi:MAG TPA: polysaccharide biosynthesis protein [Candidatus Fimadaptatus faecigallinarum]|uniref:Polysaccharide biosynthesis protein n=1 Tax=Candidatus Fimadaptatus faecigallinarum TaxID=2840814 RepID=A0A9D1LSS5_9FIRM|nr:polysaccharide biosynthesis protein [Candidatus Fimadaptatus faecigallinarum]